MNSNTLIKEKAFSFSFESLLGSFSTEEFVNSYWEQAFLHVERHNKNFYSRLLTLGDVDKILDCHKPEYGNLRVAKSSNFLNPEAYMSTDGRVKLNSVYRHYADGYSVVLKRIHQCWNPISRLCFNLSKTLSHTVQANMYLTPKYSNAYNPHIDTHDVLILQISGTKHWKIYDTLSETPLIESPGVSSIDKSALSGLKEYTLCAGDLIYIPRGVPHDAYTTDESSLHLTLGIYPVQWADLLKSVVEQIAMQNSSYRKALPFGFLNQPGISETLEESAKELFQKLAGQLDMCELINYYSKKRQMVHAPATEGHFTHLDEIDRIELTTPLLKRASIKCEVVDAEPGFVRLVYDGNTIKGPSKVRATFEFIAASKTEFTPNLLPISNPNHKIKLCQRLVRGGVLKIHR